MEALVDWVRSVGGHVHEALEHKKLNKYNRGVVVREDIAPDPGALLFHIPSEYCMNETTFAEAHAAIHARLEVPKERAGILKYLRLTIFLHLEMERGEASRFAPYLAQLPKAVDYAYHPVYQYSTKVHDRWAKINAVATALIANHVQTIELLVEESARLAPVAGSPALTFEQCRWYYLVLLTRQWGSFGLVPFADNLQHSNRSNIFLSSIRAEGSREVDSEASDVPERPGFRVPAEGLRAGQLFDNYGIGDETITYTSFGFIDEPVSDDIPRYYRVNLNNSIKVSNGLDSFKEAELRRVFKDTRAYYLTSTGLHPTVMGFLRISNISAADFRMLDPTTTYWQGIISLQNECLVHRQLLALIQAGGLLVPKEELQHAARTMARSKQSSVEWSLARLVAIRQQVVSRTIEFLVNGWTNQLQIPFKNTFSIDLHAPLTKEKTAKPPSS